MDDGRPIADYLLDDWRWNSAKFRAEGIPLPDLIENLSRVRPHSSLRGSRDTLSCLTRQDIAGLDNVQKKKTGDYNLVKGQLQTMLRKQSSVSQLRLLSSRC